VTTKSSEAGNVSADGNASGSHKTRLCSRMNVLERRAVMANAPRGRYAPDPDFDPIDSRLNETGGNEVSGMQPLCGR
jgi:hypothetical protein